jgi:asparagine synthase (glutamine-hydrolysing)
MCGIAAIYNARRTPKQNARVVEQMCDLMAHRGPDHFGYYEDDSVRLGHRRLRIIDLSAEANQPMDMDSCVIVYNGEIYNYLELRRELATRHGVEFKTSSDTEVILKSYLQYGPDCVRRFNGMFAFVLWDRLERRLFVARDRIGVKPLFMRSDPDGNHVFASDLKALWELYPLEANLDAGGVCNYFVHGYLNGLATSTTGVSKVPPATYLIIDAGGVQPVRYWDLNDVSKRRLSFDDAVGETEELLRDAVRLRLRSDVPLGCFLSGGIDSSLVTALATEEARRPIHSFSIGVDSREYDESAFAAAVARRWGAQHHHQPLTSDALEELPEIVWKYSELFGDSSAVPCYFVSKAATYELTVVLTGDGGDESFGGYIIPYAAYLAQRYRRVPAGPRAALGRLLEAAGRRASGRMLRWAHRFSQLCEMNPEDLYREFLVSDDSVAILRPDVGQRTATRIAESAFARCRSSDEVDRIIYTEIGERLIDDYLVKVDMGTMAHSLEARSPFLDFRLMEFAYALESDVKFHGYRRKAILKRIAEKYYDRRLVHRRKGGFAIPVNRWLVEDRYHPVVGRILGRKSVLHDYVDPATVEGLLGALRRSPAAHYRNVWLLLWFQIWEGLFVSRCYHRGQRLSELAA